MMIRSLSGRVGLPLAAALTSALSAETKVWNTDDGFFSDPRSWSAPGVPIESDTIQFGGTSFQALDVRLDRDATVDRMEVWQLSVLDLRATGEDRTLALQHSSAANPRAAHRPRRCAIHAPPPLQ